MRAHMATGILGCFAFDSNGKTIEYRLFPKRPDVIADKLRKSRKGEILPEDTEIIWELKRKGYKELVWSKDRQVAGILCIQKKDNIGEETMQSSYRKLAMDLRWVSSQAELNEILSGVNIPLRFPGPINTQSYSYRINFLTHLLPHSCYFINYNINVTHSF